MKSIHFYGKYQILKEKLNHEMQEMADDESGSD